MCFSRLFSTAVLVMLGAVVFPPVLSAAEVPEQFSDAHDNPRTAYPSPVPEGLAACVVAVLQHGFADFEPVRATLDASVCPGPWHKVVLRLDGAVKGRQYDRIGHLAVGGVTIFRTSTPEPSRDGITWQVEKDVTDYAPLFTTPQPVEMLLGNVVNDTYTGVFEVRVVLEFYRADRTHPAADTAHRILPLAALHEDGQDTVGTLGVPATTTRLLAEVYATGSGGGCEEFWYFAVPGGGYWCQSGQGAYREVQVLVDGQLAGIAAPYPHIYTGGWSNPFLWYTIPAPHAFNIPPVRYELTPFIGLLNDGKAHEIRFRVAGLDGGKEGWTLLPNVQLWDAPDGQQVQVTLVQAGIADSTSSSALGAEGDRQRLHQAFQRRFLAHAEIKASRDGQADIRIERTLTGEISHTWVGEEDRDDRLTAQWGDDEIMTFRPPGSRRSSLARHQQAFGLEGSITSVQVDGAPRLTTAITIHDEAWHIRGQVDGRQRSTHTSDTFSGTAAWTRGVARAQRNAAAESRQIWQQHEHVGSPPSPEGSTAPVSCIARVIASRNGVLTEDRTDTACGVAAAPADGN